MNTIIFSNAFLSEIKSLALQIAMRQRGENFLQSILKLNAKFEREREELAEASEQWDELPDVTYYTACMTIQAEGCSPVMNEVVFAQGWLAAEIRRRGVSLAQIERGTLAKYRLRAIQEKNIDIERAAILKAVAK